jgi:uncharacterized protein YyaL (SSP411 family)
MTGHTNRLADETSPYLLQHQHNPVNWHPQGAAAVYLCRNYTCDAPLTDPGAVRDRLGEM